MISFGWYVFYVMGFVDLLPLVRVRKASFEDSLWHVWCVFGFLFCNLRACVCVCFIKRDCYGLDTHVS